MTRTILMGTRKSPLALIQTEIIRERMLASLNCSFEVRPFVSKGDKILDKDLKDIGGKALFCSELNIHLLENQVDLVVHSLKDMEPNAQKDFATFYLTPSAPVGDLLISKYAIEDFHENILTIGTSAPRRIAQLKNYFTQVKIVSMRGNLMTRLEKLTSGCCDGLVLAEAGVDRQNLAEEIKQRGFNIHKLPQEEFTPAAGQGIIAVQCRSDDVELCEKLATLQIENVRRRAVVEKAFLQELSGDCHTSVGVNAIVEGADIKLKVSYFDEFGGAEIESRFKFKEYMNVVKQIAGGVRYE